MTEEKMHELMLLISEECRWEGKQVCALFLECLTNCNYHTLRSKLEPVIEANIDVNDTIYMR